MCSNCVNYGYLTSHEPAKCSRKAMLHCSHCAVYGHTFETCLKKPDPWATEPLFAGQFLPCNTVTPPSHPTPLSTLPRGEGVIAFVDDKRVIREFLRARGIKPLAGQLYTQLQEYARSQGKRLLKISRPAVERNAAAKGGKTAKGKVEEEDDEDESSDEESSDEEDEEDDEEDESDEESSDEEDEEESDEED